MVCIVYHNIHVQNFDFSTTIDVTFYRFKSIVIQLTTVKEDVLYCLIF